MISLRYRNLERCCSSHLYGGFCHIMLFPTLQWTPNSLFTFQSHSSILSSTRIPQIKH